MYTNAFRDAVLDTADGVALAAWSPFASLLTAISNIRTGSVTEATYTGYGTRPAVSYGPVGNTTPTGGRQKANDAVVTFPTNTGANADHIGVGIHTANTGGTLYQIGLLDTDPPVAGTAATSDTITAYAHGLVNDQRVFVMAAPGMVIPTGLTEGTAYFVISAATDTFQLSLTSGGAAVDITAGGAAMFLPYKAVTVATGATPEIAISALKFQL